MSSCESSSPHKHLLISPIAYAADGYARVKGIAALMTTFGVGELSAINGIAGSYAEHVPIVHIVGQPTMAVQRSGATLHHTLGDGDFDVFADMNSRVSCAVVKITNPADAPAQIDGALEACWTQARPVYIGLPSDLAKAPVDGAERLRTPLQLDLPANDPDTESEMVEAVATALRRARHPVLVVDCAVIRRRAVSEVRAICDALPIPVYTTLMGKGVVDEASPRFGGVYCGRASVDVVRARIEEESDLVLLLGPVRTDLNTGVFTAHIDPRKIVRFDADSVRVKQCVFPDLHLPRSLHALHTHLLRHPDLVANSHALDVRREPATVADSTVITHRWLWSHLSSWFRTGDVIVGEMGTAMFGVSDATTPPDTTVVSQVLWGSIGYSVGACQGAALGLRDSDSPRSARRTVLFVGDGSFQVTGQELSSIIRHGLKPIM